MKKNNGFSLITIIILLAVLIVAYFTITKYFYPKNNTTNSVPTTAATQPAAVAQTQTANVSIIIKNFAFNSKTITVKSGTTVTWINNDSVAHQAVSDAPAFDSGILSPGGKYSFTFNKAGDFNYHCQIHPSMTGQVTVTP